MYGALDVYFFPNKRLNVDLKNIEIWVSHGLNEIEYIDSYWSKSETKKFLDVFLFSYLIKYTVKIVYN